MSEEDERNATWTAAASACLDAYRTFKATAQHCHGDQSDSVRACAGSFEDCADATLLAANMFTRRSPFGAEAAVFCADVAGRTAASFSALEHGVPELRSAFAACQNVIRVCSEAAGEREPTRADARDEALVETFPASDATPTASHAT